MDEHARSMRIREYARQRLRAEADGKPRGYQAALCREMGITSAHMTNILKADRTRGVGEVVARKLAAHWGMSFAELEREACGESPPPEPERAAAPLSAEEMVTILRTELDRIREEEHGRATRAVRPRKAR